MVDIHSEEYIGSEYKKVPIAAGMVAGRFEQCGGY